MSDNDARLASLLNYAQLPVATACLDMRTARATDKTVCRLIGLCTNEATARQAKTVLDYVSFANTSSMTELMIRTLSTNYSRCNTQSITSTDFVVQLLQYLVTCSPNRQANEALKDFIEFVKSSADELETFEPSLSVVCNVQNANQTHQLENTRAFVTPLSFGNSVMFRDTLAAHVLATLFQTPHTNVVLSGTRGTGVMSVARQCAFLASQNTATPCSWFLFDAVKFAVRFQSMEDKHYTLNSAFESNVLKFAKNASSDGVPVLVVTAAHVWVESEMNRLFLLMLNTRPDVRCVFVSYADEPRKQDFRSETSHVCNWVEVPMLSTAQVVSVCEKATRNMTGVTTDAVVHAAQSLPLPLLAACKSILNLLQTPAFARARNLRPRMLLPCSVLPVEDDARRQTFSVEDVERAAALLRGAKMDDRAMYSMLAERLPSLLQNLKSRVFGQDAALDKIVTTVTERVLLRDSDDAAPIATMIFLGPTGTGKTETARCLAEFLLNARDGCLTKFDMSEFKDHENITKLLGTTAGFIGFNNTPLLTDALRKQLPRIMLFDEAEKADPEVFDLFLSVFDKDGTITDGAGRTLAFRQTLVVLTSNIGSNAVSDEDAKQQLLTFFKPEFLARIDCVVRFSPLSHVAQKSIVQRALDAVQRKFAELGIVFDMDSQLVDFFSAKVQTLGGGARSVVRCVNTEFALLFKHELVSRIKVKGVRVCCLNDTLTRVDAAQGHAQQHAGQTSEAHD